MRSQNGRSSVVSDRSATELYGRKKCPIDMHTKLVRNERAQQFPTAFSDRHAHKFGRRKACTIDFRPTCTQLRSEKCVHDRFSTDVHTNSVGEVRARLISDQY